jgi:formyltetrahydrofolate synthetase
VCFFRQAAHHVRSPLAFVFVSGGDIMTIPGLPTRPGFYDVDIDVETGQVIGLF